MLLNKKINWFPGHMKKASDEILKIISKVDILIEVLDSRAISSSSNPDLFKFIQNKLHFKIALKSDLAEDIKNNEESILKGSLKDNSFRNKIINKLESIIKVKKEKLISKGLKNPKFLVLVIGLPNVGKSSLINFLKQKKILESRNIPGLTKQQRIVSINQTFDLIDTPGILIRNIFDDKVAYNLSLINCIKKEVLPIEDVLKYGFDFLNKNYKEKLYEYYNINEYESFFSFCNEISIKFGYIQKNNEIDYYRMYDKLFNDISLSKITKINYEK